jgi:nucleotidyltransferase substrate binding protein (TIGR01987 family)
MQRRLKLRGVDTGSPSQVLRAAAKEGFIHDLDLWLEFLKMRNLTVQTYNVDVAEEVYGAAMKLPAEVDQLMQNLLKP